MRGLLGFLGAFRSDAADDRQRPDVNVGLAFLIAAVVVAVAGLNWMSSGDDGGTSGADGWALGGASAVAGAPEDGLIPASPPAVAVRVGAENPGAGPETRDPPSTEPAGSSTVPDGSGIGLDPSITTGPSDPGSTATTHTSTTALGSTTTDGPTSSSSSSSTPSTQPTSTETTETTTVASPQSSGEPNQGLLGGLVGLLQSIGV